jgi:hypothetical protein
VLVTYRFEGSVDELYASLVVRIHYAEVVETDQLWKSAADFKTQTGKRLGLKLTRETEGAAKLEIYFSPDVDLDTQVIFRRYVHDHLTAYATHVVAVRHYHCLNRRCKAYGRQLTEQIAIDDALAAGGASRVFCPACGKPIMLRDAIEKKLESAALQEHIRDIQIKSNDAIDNESNELILVGHAYSISGEAGQIFRQTANSDHGIDGEIEFKDDDGKATGKRLYLQLKSGDSYLRRRKRDGAEIFQIKKSRWSTYWQQHAYAVMVVIRTSDGEIRWMDVSTYLRRERKEGKTAVKQVVFQAERFDAMSVRAWRDRILGQPQ